MTAPSLTPEEITALWVDDDPPAGYERVKMTVGQCEFSASKALKKMTGYKPKRGMQWYVWPDEINSLQAAMAGALLGPFATEAEARHIAETTEMCRKVP